MHSTPDIAVLWHQRDGTSCVLSRRGESLVLSLQRRGAILAERAVQSPREALDVANEWRGGDTRKES
jgi:hypothetical protein